MINNQCLVSFLNKLENFLRSQGLSNVHIVNLGIHESNSSSFIRLAVSGPEDIKKIKGLQEDLRKEIEREYPDIIERKEYKESWYFWLYADLYFLETKYPEIHKDFSMIASEIEGMKGE